MPDSRIPDLSTVESPPPDPDLTYGQLKDGEVVDSGGQAIVRRASISDPESDSPETVAVKEPLAPNKTVDRETTTEFLQEAKTWQTLANRERQQQVRDTDHIVGVVAIGDDAPWIAMEHMDGGSLADLLESHPDGLPVDQALWIGECLCKGIKLAHDNGVAHLDLKPANILFRKTSDGQWNVPKIADWGLSRALLDESQSMEMFSVEYAAPEQFDSDLFGKPDKYTDIYQIGVIIYQLLTGRPPYTGGQANIMHDVVYGDDPDPPSTQRDTISATIDEALLRALSTDKSQRYHGEIKRFEEVLRDIRTSKSKKIDRETEITDDKSPSVEIVQDSWNMFQGGAARSGYSPHSTGPTQSVTKRWAFDVGEGVYSSPVECNGTVYIGGRDGDLYALDAVTGEQQWSKTLHTHEHSVINAAPAVVEGTVYASVYKSSNTSICALDSSTGDKQWCFETGDHKSSLHSHSQFCSSPAVVDGTVYVGDLDSSVYAIDAATGHQQWRFETNHRIRSSPAVVDNTVYIGSDDENVYALNAINGNLKWSFETKNIVKSSPTVDNGTVYIGSSDGHIYALDAATGDQQWRFDANYSISSSPAVADGTVYIADNDITDGYLYAIDSQSGSQQWCFETDSDVLASPAVADGTIYITDTHGQLYALNTATGDEQWKLESSSFAISSPAVIDDTVYVAIGEQVYALE